MKSKFDGRLSSLSEEGLNGGYPANRDLKFFNSHKASTKYNKALQQHFDALVKGDAEKAAKIKESALKWLRQTGSQDTVFEHDIQKLITREKIAATGVLKGVAKHGKDAKVISLFAKDYAEYVKFLENIGA